VLAEDALGGGLGSGLNVGHAPRRPQTIRHRALLVFPAALVGLALLLRALAALLLLLLATLARQLGAHHVAEGRAAGRAWSVTLRVRQLGGARRALDREADLALDRVDGDDLDLDLLARLEQRARIVDALIRDLGDVDQPLDALLELDEGAEVEDLEHL